MSSKGPVDYVYRFDPRRASTEVVPDSPQAARDELERGNRLFAQWVDSCRSGQVKAGGREFVLNCNHLGAVMGWDANVIGAHHPFAIIIGCSDARAPLEMILGQTLNELFVVRVAGNIVDTAGQGSIDYALEHLGASVKLVVVMGHAGCGAVTGAVDAYLNPSLYWDHEVSPSLRAILRRIMIVVHEGAAVLERVHGESVSSKPGYRQALIDMSVALNAAQTAFDLQHAVHSQKRDVEVNFGVYDLRSGKIDLPGEIDDVPKGLRQGLQPAPTRLFEFQQLGEWVAYGLKATLEIAPAVPAAGAAPAPPACGHDHGPTA